MVYEGKPSRGCKNCKKSHAKCDEARPSCFLCVKRKLECPGYQDDFDLVLRDQTSAIQAKARRKYHRKTPQPLPSPKVVDHEESLTRVKKDRHPGESSFVPITASLADTLEQRALCFFFASFVLIDRHPESSLGFLELLFPLYQDAERHSSLSMVTQAISMIILGSSSQHKPMQRMGRKAFGDALILTQTAIQDPMESKSNKTLASVLALGFAENLIAIEDKTMPSGLHEKGALALVKHRGAANFDDEMAQKLFIAVQADRIGSAVQNCIDLGEYLSDFAEDVSQLPLTVASRLSFLGADVAALKARAKSVLGTVSNGESGTDFDTHFSDLWEFARGVDPKLGSWEAFVPDEWRPQPASDLSPLALLKFQAYGTRMDIYPDLWVTSVWNVYRILRLIVQGILMSCCEHNPFGHLPNITYGPQSNLPMMRGLVDDICASVPFSVGDREPQSQKEPDYPWTAGSTVALNHRRAAYALGGWFLLGPLDGCVDLETSVNPGVKVIGPEQRAWLMTQKSRLGKFYKIATSDLRHVCTIGARHIAPKKPSLTTVVGGMTDTQ